MTAVNYVRQRDALHFITDGAAYSPSGVLLGVTQKATAFAHLPAVFCIRGPVAARGMLTNLTRVATFDAMVADFELEFEREFEHCASALTDTGLPDVEMMFGGWSEAAQEFQVYMISSCDGADRIAAEQLEARQGLAMPDAAFKLKRLEDVAAIAPNVPVSEISIAYGRPLASIDDIRDIDEFGIVLLELQRARLISNAPGLSPCCNIGGFGQVTTITRDAVSSRIICRWPDQVGEMMCPRPIDWPAWRRARQSARVASVLDDTEGLSKLKRDMLARKAAKGKLRVAS